MEKLKEYAIKEVEKRFDERIIKLETDKGLKEVMGFEGKDYKKNPKEKTIKLLEKLKEKEINEIETQIKAVKEAKDFSGEFIITIEWKKSYMWGSNPKASTNYGFEGSSIGGCGYCKHSTATAEALNSNLSILKLLYAKKNKELEKYLKKNKNKDYKNDFNRDILGYGSGYWTLPTFEGGVGVTSHEIILKNVGLEMRNISSTKTTDVHLIKKIVGGINK